METKHLLVIISVLLVIFNLISSSAKDFNLTEFKEKLPELLGANNAGTEFWITFNPTSEWIPENDIMIYISSAFETKVTVEITGKGYIRTQTTIPNDIIEFTLTSALGQCYRINLWENSEPDQVYRGYGVHISTQKPIIVYGVLRYGYNSESFLALPVTSLGKEYIVSSWKSNPGTNIDILPCHTAVVSPYDNNIVNFLLGGSPDSETAGGQLQGETRNYTLQKGDVLLISSAGDHSDLSGSRILSTKPVSVVSSNFCAYVPENTNYCNFLIEMELPTYSWEKNYLYTPIYGRLKNSFIKIFSNEPNTIVYRDGVPLDTLTAGGGIENAGWTMLRADTGTPRPIVFSADKPIYVEQYNCGQLDDNIESYTFMMVLPPYEQFQKEITFNLPGVQGNGYNFEFNYMNIVFKVTNDGKYPDDLEIAIARNGKFIWEKMSNNDPKVGLPFSTQINGKTYYYKTIRLPGYGVYKLRANDPFGAYAYGFSSWQSYGHPASVALWDLTKNDSIAPQPKCSMDCDGTINDGEVEDLPNDTNNRSNLYLIIFQPDSSFNYDFTFDEFIPRESGSVKWNANVIDKKKDAKLVISFIDGSGNDTTIVVNYESNFLNIKPDVEFGKLKIVDTVIKEVMGYNEQSHPILIDSLILKYKDQGFEISYQGTPLILDVGAAVKIELRFIATKLGEFTDSLGNNPCSNLSFYSAKVHAIVDTVNSVEEVFSNHLTLSPNPAEDFIILNGMNSSDFAVKIYDIWGTKIFEEKYFSTDDEIRIPTKEFPNGFYFVQVINNRETLKRKFCVVR
ncbi:MAG: T9SS type A sorting domain-containing protein [Ignavibacteriae bacterium]|nr:T9SS type A sorting domain-containing protein [Ignavibacteriota bacterium]